MVHTPAFYYTQTDYEIPNYTAVSWNSQVIFINITVVLESSDIYIAKAMATCFGCLAIFKSFLDLCRYLKVKAINKMDVLSIVHILSMKYKLLVTA
jgi:hypothetical protein